ncbi:hypothetical protein [Novosphingobium rosa]|uniref:hypothetical protein n=1 Tax=Novosphingobium rosa TaxID=76978 RepID=UPI000A83A501|nr:hypothetical protein [Novosphingobium rosa]
MFNPVRNVPAHAGGGDLPSALDEGEDTVFADDAIVERGFALMLAVAAGRIAPWRVFGNRAAFQAALG